MKRSLIERALRGDIISGRLSPGGRLPTRSEIEIRFAAGPLTVQQAIDRLAHDGFVVARGPRGTFVAENPPHLSRYGLVFAYHPGRSRYWMALWKSAAATTKDGQRKVEIFDDVADHNSDENYKRLLNAVRSERLAGLIFANVPTEFRDTPLLADPSLPRVAVMPEGIVPGVASIQLNMQSYVEKALDYFVARGRRRLALISALNFHRDEAEPLARGAAQRGIEMRPYWQQMPDINNPQAIRNCLHLLMRGGQSERPDCLLIADDNLVEDATAGLVAADVRVPNDVEVVAHCNFPYPPPSSTPLKRLGFDARDILDACVRSIDRQRAGESLPVTPAVLAKLEDEQ